MVTCEKCQLALIQADFSSTHNSNSCLERQLANKSAIVTELESRMKLMKDRLDYYEFVMERIVRGENLPLSYEFHTSFPMNFHFNSHEVRLVKASWNSTKEKFDFLHFYITYPIKTEAFVGS